MTTMTQKHDFRIERKFTALHRKHSGEHPALTEAKCRLGILQDTLRPIEKEDLIVGQFAHPRVGFTDYRGYYCDLESAKIVSADRFTSACKREVQEIANYWSTRTTKAQFWNAISHQVKEAWDSFIIDGSVHTAGTTPNFKRASVLHRTAGRLVPPSRTVSARALSDRSDRSDHSDIRRVAVSLNFGRGPSEPLWEHVSRESMK